MTYDKVFKYGTCKESQYGHRPAQGIRFFCRDGNKSINSLWGLETAGVSLCERGRVCRQTDTDTGPEDCLHGQALRKSYAGDSPIRPIQGPNVKRNCQRGYRSLTRQRPGEWQNQRKRKEQLSWNIALTGCHHARSARHTSFLFLIKVGLPTLVRIM